MDLIWWLMRRSHEVHEMDHGQTVDLGSGPTGPALDALRSGFKLLAYSNPVALARIERSCARYLFFDTAAPEYWPLARAIVLGKEGLLSANNGQIALALVHEATHARLVARGISARLFGLERVEKVCIGRERAVARTFPNSEEWVRYVEAKAATRWWARGRTAAQVQDQLGGGDARGGWRSMARFLGRWATRNHPR